MNNKELENKVLKQLAAVKEISNLFDDILNDIAEPPQPDWDKPPFESQDKYWFIDDEGDMRAVTWQDDIVDKYNYLIGNMFKTVTEAETAHKKQKALARIWRHADFLKQEKVDCNNAWQVILDVESNDITYQNSSECVLPNIPIFRDREQIMQHIAECEEDYRVLCEVR